MSEQYAHPEAIVSTQWVADHLGDQDVIVAEVDADLDANYRKGHVPGAAGWGLHTDMEDQVRRDLPGAPQLEHLLSNSGVSNDSTLVLYGDGNNRSATWAFWVLKYYGHSNLRLMNGGRDKWTGEARPISTEEPARAATNYRVSPPDEGLRATKEYIVERLDDPSLQVLDTRTAEEFRGELTSAAGSPQSGIYRKGRIPGAVHVPWDDGAGDDGSFKSVDELRSLYEGRGIEGDLETVSYCRLGVRASYSWFVLKYLLGYASVRVYDGSWTEWGNSVGVPIETDSA